MRRSADPPNAGHDDETANGANFAKTCLMKANDPFQQSCDGGDLLREWHDGMPLNGVI